LLKELSTLKAPLQTPFDTIENAHDYVRLLVEAIAEAKSEIATDLDAPAQAQPERRVEALRLVQFKLDKLEQHLQNSSRLLNDLRTLRRLLFDERPESNSAGKDSAA
jgi:formiminotetrahydrofolate cyclodeaminase